MLGLIVALCNGALTYFSVSQLTDKQFPPTITGMTVGFITFAAWLVGKLTRREDD